MNDPFVDDQAPERHEASIEEIARWHRIACRVWVVSSLAQLLTYFSPSIMRALGFQVTSPQVAIVFVSLLIVAALSTIITAAMYAGLMRRSTGSLLRALLAAIMLIPLVTIIAGLVIESLVRVRLHGQGLKVGVFGASLASIEHFIGRGCHKCGYDLTGTPGNICPECGTRRAE